MAKKEVKYTKGDIIDAMQYGMGFVCGKHNLNLTKKERLSKVNELIDYLKLKKERRKF
jgi:lipid-A-disaccharide synthase-like uncharacterized protein